MNQQIYRCKRCGNIISFVKNSGAPIVCCNEKMTELIPNTVDASMEKHVPTYEVKGNVVHVKVGETEHPMLPEHCIEWVSLQTKQVVQCEALFPWEKPEVCFSLCADDEVEAVYAYCNLHGLWKR